jgi:1-acyl-sn-glycerol-3-phosphate acyltransferase
MIAERLAAAVMIGAVRLLTGAQARWRGCGPSDVQRVYYANHSSHADFVLIWSVLPGKLRRKTRPVAAGDYWSHGALRRFLIERVFHGVLISRGKIEREHNPITAMCAALADGSSLILFPEGTRGSGEEVQPFKPGVFHLALARGDVELVPVWIDNSYRVMPKGVALPIPLLCSVAFGKPQRLEAGEGKPEFLDRLRRALMETGSA